MKVLNVAEKNDAAKNIAAHLSRGTSTRREGKSKFNKIYEFSTNLWNQNCKMVMTSVSGHLLTYEFDGAYRKWQACPPLSLFEAPVSKICKDDYQKIKETIEKEVRGCGALIIWTDCDREGENIGYEIIETCQAIKPNIKVYRAKFSEITQISVDRALRNLEQPNKNLSDAVDVRSELDLRIGAAFTRFQTLRLKQKFPETLADMLISYGPCQFPTLGFVVERFLAIERFEPEPYWKLKVTHEQNNLTVEFRWGRNRLFEKLPCEVFLDICQENPQATVEKVINKPKSKWRPLPLDTIELEKQGSRKLHLSAKETMKIAEKLYTQGFISYPRTETNIFPKEMNLTVLVEQQSGNNAWGQFAQRVLQDGVSPRQGKKSDQAHPPIHPTKYTDTLHGDEGRVYEFVVRHFLACVSKNAEGYETIVEIDIAGEKFITNGLQIIAKNYLEVYIYEKWSDKEIHIYEQGQTFTPTSIEMLEESTSPPNLLTEADLIALMDKHGIGTDATHAEHIETIKARQYIGLKDNKYLIPGKLGIGLVMGYDRMGFQMSKPHLRAELENDLKLICEGQKNPDEVRQRITSKYRAVYVEAFSKAAMIDTALAEYLNEQPNNNVEYSEPAPEVPVLKCPKCNSNMVIKSKYQDNRKYIGCMSYPTCNNAIWLPDTVEDIEALDENCNRCPSNILRKVKVQLRRNAFPHFGTTYTTCIGGCDEMFNDLLGIRLNSVRRVQEANDTGYESNASARSNASQRNQQPGQRNQPSAQRNQQPAQRNQQSAQRNQQSAQQQNQNRNDNVNNWNDNPRSNNQNQNARNQGGNSSGASNWKVPNSFGGSTGTANRATSSSSVASTSTSNDLPNWVGGDDDGEIMCNCHQVAKQLVVRKEGPNQGRTFYKCAKEVGKDCDFFLWGSDGNADGGGGGGGVVRAAQRPAPQQTWNQNQSTNNRHNNSFSGNISGDWGEDDGGWSGGRAAGRGGWGGGSGRGGWSGGSSNRGGGGGWNSRGDGGGGSGDGDIMCNCGNPARKLTVFKEGPNKGRQFYGCPQGVKSNCNFFKWAEEVEDGGGGGGDGWGGGGGGGGWGRGNQGGGSGRGAGSSRGKTRGRGDGGPAAKKPRTTAATGGTKRKCGVCGVEGHTKRTCPQNRD